MSKAQEQRWLNETGAGDVLGEQAQSVAAELVRAYRYYVRTGKWHLSGQPLEDYTVFFHLFALRYGQDDPRRYHWLVKNGEKIMGTRAAEVLPNLLCPLCGAVLNSANVARNGRQLRLSARARAWCKQCSQIYDS